MEMKHGIRNKDSEENSVLNVHFGWNFWFVSALKLTIHFLPSTPRIRLRRDTKQNQNLSCPNITYKRWVNVPIKLVQFNPLLSYYRIRHNDMNICWSQHSTRNKEFINVVFKHTKNQSFWSTKTIWCLAKVWSRSFDRTNWRDQCKTSVF